MEWSLIIQATVGLTVVGGGGAFIISPSLFGVYYDVDIYLYDTGTSVQLTDAPSDPVTVDNSKGTKTMKCWIDENDKLPCDVFAAKAEPNDDKHTIDASGFDQAVKTDLTAPAAAKIKYYKITVSEKLLWKLQKLDSQDVSVSSTNENATSRNLKPLFAYDKSSILTTNKKPMEYQYTGKVSALPKKEKPENQGVSGTPVQVEVDPVNTITKNDNYNYSCSSWQSSLSKCEIYNLQSGDTEESDIVNVTFAKNDTARTTVNDGKLYLIKMHYTHPTDLYLQTYKDGETPTTKNIMKIKELKPAFIADVNGTNKLFHF